MSGFYFSCDGHTELLALPRYFRFKDYHTISNEWFNEFGIACSWTQPNSLLHEDGRRLVMLIDEFNNDPEGKTLAGKPKPDINLAILEILGITILGPVLLFVTEPYTSRSHQEVTQIFNLTVEECQSEIPFLLSCFRVMDTEYAGDVYYWLMPGIKEEVLTDPTKMMKLKFITDKLGIRDKQVC